MKHIPNLLTLLRFFAAGAAIFTIQHPVPYCFQWFAGIILFAGITDAIDGPIARKLGVATKNGGYFDHCVDLFFFAAIMYGLFHIVDQNICIVLVILQFLTTTVGILQFVKKADDVWPNEDGKWSIITLVIATILVTGFSGTRFQTETRNIGYFFFGISVIRRLESFWRYWQWLQKRGFLWREECKQVGKDPG